MKKQLSIFLLVVVSSFTFAQKASVEQGDWTNLKEITAYNLEFDYSNLEIPKYKSEEDFLKDKMQKRENKEAGTGEKFKKSWFADRENRYEPKFIESFNKRFKDGGIKVGKDLSNAEYTMKVHTTFLYAGYNVGVVRKNSKLEAIVSVYKNNAPDNILFSAKYTKVEGKGAMGYDFDSGYRISEAYAKLSKTIAAHLKKKAK